MLDFTWVQGDMDKVDVIVLGATGYTGRLVCEYLRDRAPEAGQTWGVAGRRKDALDALAAEFGANSVVVGDCTNDEDCEAFAAAGKTIANLAGPYYHRAEKIVGACARAGTHYLDLTGELVFVRDIIDQYHAIAAASGAKIAPVAGYESLPFDLMALALLEGFMDIYGESPERIDLLAGSEMPEGGVGGMSEMISGGTAETMRVMLEEDHSGLSSDPAALNPKDDPEIETVRKSVPYQLLPQAGDMERQSIPIFPGPFLHPAVVNRTFALLRQEQKSISPTVRYRERMSAKGMGPDWMRGAVSVGMSMNASIMNWLLSTSLKTPRRFVKSMADRYLPQPGEGPDVTRIDDWHW
ncbi:MAG: saccharopine dehydrogenase NADP-binding domain-containing protein, partial [Proteobacteria bacterium]|nr:saccharopine dehydrogenase NADP-binding domain-containing protein [Pseudomonadota bacterium]